MQGKPPIMVGYVHRLSSRKIGQSFCHRLSNIIYKVLSPLLPSNDHGVLQTLSTMCSAAQVCPDQPVEPLDCALHASHLIALTWGTEPYGLVVSNMLLLPGGWNELHATL